MSKAEKRVLPQAARKALGANIADARDRAGLNQTALAKVAKVDRSYLSTLENEGKGVGLALLLDIAVGIGCPIDSLMGGVDERYDAIIEARFPIDAKRHYETKIANLRKSYGEVMALLAERGGARSPHEAPPLDSDDPVVAPRKQPVTRRAKQK